MWGVRAQIDRKLYKKYIQEELFEKTPNLDVVVGSVEDLIVENPSCDVNNLPVFDCRGVILS